MTPDPVMSFLAPLEYTINKSRYTVLCEGTWTVDENDVTRLRVDSELFPAFWISGELIGDALTIDGGRFDDTWTDRPVRHTEFVCAAEEATFAITHGSVELTIPRPGSRTVIGFGADSEAIRFPSSFDGGFMLKRR